MYPLVDIKHIGNQIPKLIKIKFLLHALGEKKPLNIWRDLTNEKKQNNIRCVCVHTFSTPAFNFQTTTKKSNNLYEIGLLALPFELELLILKRKKEKRKKKKNDIKKVQLISNYD